MFIRQWAQDKAPELDEVRAQVLQILKGRKLTGYHLNQKLKIFDIFNQVEFANENMFDCANIFDKEKRLQIPFDTLCETFLHMKFHKKKNTPHAYTEAKICMALFQKWIEINANDPDNEDLKPSFIRPD